MRIIDIINFYLIKKRNFVKKINTLMLLLILTALQVSNAITLTKDGIKFLDNTVQETAVPVPTASEEGSVLIADNNGGLKWQKVTMTYRQNTPPVVSNGDFWYDTDSGDIYVGMLGIWEVLKSASYESCNEMLSRSLSVKTSGYYVIERKGVEMTVYCDMTTDGGGYTMLKIPLLSTASNNQQITYRNRCAEFDMELIVPRTKEHAKSIYSVMGVPNLVGIYPDNNGAHGLDDWGGRCNGLDCSFWISDNNNANYPGGQEPNGNNQTDCGLVRWDRTWYKWNTMGSWDDQNCNVIYKGTAFCSTNDK